MWFRRFPVPGPESATALTGHQGSRTGDTTPVAAATRSRRGDAAAVLLLAFLVTLFFADVLFGSGRFFIRDLTRYYYPTKRIIREVILAGEFPYWNPYYSAGQPMAANPEYEIFYPLQLLILLPDYDLGFRLHVIIHYLIAAIGMYLLLRSMDLGLAASLFGAISSALGGLYMSLGNLLPILFAAAWIPWILLFVRRLLLTPTSRHFALAALFLGMQNLVAEPTTMIQTWALCGIYAIYRAWYARAAPAIAVRGVLLALLVIAAGLIVGAVQLIPAFDHVGDSARARPFTFDLVTSWSMPWVRPLELLFPHILGHIYSRGTYFWGGGIYPGVGSPFLFSMYSGLLAALMLVLAVFIRPRGSRLVLLIAMGSVLLAAGRNSPLYRWLYDAGIAQSIRYPEKFALMALVACTILSAVLFDSLARGDPRALRVALIAVLSLSVVSLAMAIFAQTDFYALAFADLWGLRKSPNLSLLVKMSRQDWTLNAARMLTAALLIGVGYRLQRGPGSRVPSPGSQIAEVRPVTRDPGPGTYPTLRAIWVSLLLIFLLIDLAPVQLDVLPRVQRSFLTPPPIARALDPDRSDYRIFHEADWYGTTEVARKFFGTGDAVYWIVRNGLYPMTPASWGFRTVLERDYDKTQLLPTIDFTDAIWRVKNGGRKDWREVAMAMSNARYHAQYRNFNQERERAKGRLKTAQPVDFIKGQNNPRYYFATQLATARDGKQFSNKLTGQTWDRRVAFVGFPGFTPGVGRILDQRETANTVRLEVETRSRAFLVMAVTPHKYWQATLDSQPALLKPANIGYQGLIIPPGRHVVHLRYRNPLVAYGGMISLGAVALFAGMALFGPARQRVRLQSPA